MTSPLSSQIEEWAREQREGWLARLYGEADKDTTDVKRLSTDSVQSHLVTALCHVLSGEVRTAESVEHAADLVVSQREPSIPFANLQGMCLHAAEAFSDEAALERLADWLVALAHLPDALNHSTEGMIESQTMLPDGTWGTRVIKPGKPIRLEEGLLWRDLPGFSMNVTERTQGPEQYLIKHRGKDSPEGATAKWTNLNTFLAMIIRHPGARDRPSLTRTASSGFKTLIIALEYKWDEQSLTMHIPAASQMMRLAGERLRAVAADGTVDWHPGPLWAKRGGGKACDAKRFAFWESRLAKLGPLSG